MLWTRQDLLLKSHRFISMLCVLLLFASVVSKNASAATQTIDLTDNWGEYDPKLFGTGVQTLSNLSSSGFTSSHNGTTADHLERPRVYQEFSALDMSQVGQKITATFDVQFHTVPSTDGDAGETRFRFAFGDRVSNQGMMPMMVDLGQTNGTSFRQRYDNSLTDYPNDPAGAFVPGMYDGFLSASDSIGSGGGNPTSPDDSQGEGGIRDTVHIHSFTATAERVIRNVDSFPFDGIADREVEGWYLTNSWTSDEDGAEVAFVDTNRAAAGTVFDADTGLGVFPQSLMEKPLDSFDVLGFVIYTNDPFKDTADMGSYTISNFVLEYDDGALAADFDDDGDVDESDLAIWDPNYGLSGTATKPDGDTDADMDVDGSDFLAWQQEYTGALTTIAAANAVPEPSSLLLLAAATLIGTATRRRA